MVLYVDIETRSHADLTKTGVHRYVENSGFKVLMCAWAINDGPVRVATTQDEIRGIPWENQNTIVAHNASFERVCLTTSGIPSLAHPARWDDTAAHAAVRGYPRSLADAAIALGAAEAKDSAGTRLINLFSKPNRKGEFNTPETHPEKWQEFVDYCAQDVEVLRVIHKLLGPWDAKEYAVWLEDQWINERGIAVDRDFINAAVEANNRNHEANMAECKRITGLDNPNSRDQMLGWLHENGVNLPNLQKATVTEALAGEDLPDAPRRVLTLREEMALASGKKYLAAVNHLCEDGRLRGAFAYSGAHTGRWAGRGVQLQNLPGGKIETPEQIEDMENVILDTTLGSDVSGADLKKVIRGMFVGPFVVADYSAIEARVIAWLAGESWALEAFRAGRDIYVETAERMGGLTRQQGKVAVLGLGYGGGVGALRVMGAQGDDAELKMLVTQYRAANKNIEAFWYRLEKVFRSGGTAGRITVERDGSDRLVRLPSGRALEYHNCKLTRKETRFGERKVITFSDPRNVRSRQDTYGGRLAENVTQAVARDVLANALVNLGKEGFNTVAHVHDEVIVEAPEDQLNPVIETITRLPEWAEGLPVSAEGYATERYRKA